MITIHVEIVVIDVLHVHLSVIVQYAKIVLIEKLHFVFAKLDFMKSKIIKYVNLVHLIVLLVTLQLFAHLVFQD